MIKSMVVAIDSTESSARAQEYALTLAKRYNAELTGIAVLDVPWITAPMATPIGGGYYKEHRDQTILANRSQLLDDKINAFRKLCEDAGVVARAVEVEGEPAEQIDYEADRHDLIIIGRETNFHGVKGHDIGDVVEQLLKDTPRPVIVVPPNNSFAREGTMVAFDGSQPSSRAMQVFHLMGLANGGPVHVVSVDADRGKAEELAARGAEYFKSHEVEVTAHGVQASGEIARTILNTSENLEVGMLVMGAFANRSLMRQIFVGSITKQIIRAGAMPVFVHH